MTFEQLLKASHREGLLTGIRGLRVRDILLYLDRGGDINRRADDGNSLLHIAADNAEMDAIRFLVSRGANVNARGYHGYTPLHLAVDSDCDTASRNGLRATVLPITQTLLALGADESIRDDDGKTARDIAAAYGERENWIYDALPRARK